MSDSPPEMLSPDTPPIKVSVFFMRPAGSNTPETSRGSSTTAIMTSPSSPHDHDNAFVYTSQFHPVVVLSLKRVPNPLLLLLQPPYCLMMPPPCVFLTAQHSSCCRSLTDLSNCKRQLVIRDGVLEPKWNETRDPSKPMPPNGYCRMARTGTVRTRSLFRAEPAHI